MNIVVVQMVNYTLAFLMYMIIGRGFLRLIIGDRPNIMALAFRKVTEPVYNITRRIFPFVGERWVPVVSFFLLAAVRVAMIVILQPAAGR